MSKNTITSKMGGTTTPLIYEYDSKTLFDERKDKGRVAELASVPGDRNRSGLLQCNNGSTERLSYNRNFKVKSVFIRSRDVKKEYVYKAGDWRYYSQFPYEGNINICGVDTI